MKYKISVVSYLNTIPFIFGLKQFGLDKKLREFESEVLPRLSGSEGEWIDQQLKEIEEAKEKLYVNILDVAEPAVKKAKPKGTLIVILCIILGGMSGITTTLVRNAVKLEK